MGKSELPAKSVRATEGFGGKCGQMIDMLGLARPNEWLEQRILQNTGIEGVFKSVQRLFTTSEFIERCHDQSVTCKIRFGTGMVSASCCFACKSLVRAVGDVYATSGKMSIWGRQRRRKNAV